MFMLSSKKLIKVALFQKLANQSMLNGASLIKIISVKARKILLL